MMPGGIGSPQRGSIIESLDAARLVEKILEEIASKVTAGRGSNPAICVLTWSSDKLGRVLESIVNEIAKHIHE